MNQRKNNIAPLLTVRWGHPNENEGGPLNIIAKLLSSFSKLDIFDQYGFVSASCSIVIQKREKYIANINQVRTTTLRDRFKNKLSNIAYNSVLGHSIALDRDCRRLKKRIKSYPFIPNIIHSHNIISSGLLFPYNNTRAITTIHYKGSLIEDGLALRYPYIKGSRLERRYANLETAGVLKSDVITFPSHEAKRMFEQSHPELITTKRVEIIYNGINIEEFPIRQIEYEKNARQKKEVIVLNVAAMIPQKRFDIVLEVFKVLLQRGLNLKLVHIGDGPLYDYFLKQIINMGLEKYVEIHKSLPHSEVIKHLYYSSIHFLPSENVVFDLVTLEAMAAGLPSVLTNDGGNKELVQDRHDGILINKGDIKGYADSIQKLIENEALWFTISKNSRKKIEQKFTQEHMAKEYFKIYADL